MDLEGSLSERGRSPRSVSLTASWCHEKSIPKILNSAMRFSVALLISAMYYSYSVPRSGGEAGLLDFRNKGGLNGEWLMATAGHGDWNLATELVPNREEMTR